MYFEGTGKRVNLSYIQIKKEIETRLPTINILNSVPVNKTKVSLCTECNETGEVLDKLENMNSPPQLSLKLRP